MSSRTTVTDDAVPVKLGSGTKVTVPSDATVYVPMPSTVFVVEPSSNLAGTTSFIGTRLSPSVNAGLPVCVAP